MDRRGIGGRTPQRPMGAGCRQGWSLAGSMMAVVAWGLLPGCGSSPPPAPAPQAGDDVRVMPVVPEEVREQLLDGAVAVLSQLDDYEEESAFAQVFDRLNQWSHAAVISGATAASAWRVDPLFATLPARLRRDRFHGSPATSTESPATSAACTG
ncbi:MAG: hypothetical protein ACKOHK_14795 [Planctomycetia bacterium]